MIRLISMFLSVSILFIVSCLPVAAITVPDGASPTHSVNYFMYYLNSQTGYNATYLEHYTRLKANSLTVSDLETTNYVWCYPFADMALSDGTRLSFQKNNTYHLQLQFSNGNRAGYSVMSNFPARFLQGSSQALTQSLIVTNYCNDNTYSCTIVDSYGFTQVDIVFHLTSDLPGNYYYVAPFIRFTGGTEMVISNYNVSGYIDPDFSIFQSLIMGQLDLIKGAINDAADQAHQDSIDEQNILTSIEAAISGGSEDHPNTGSSDELADLEGDIITDVSTVTLPNGTTVSASGNIFEQLYSWIHSEYSPVEFDENAASVVSELFDTFMPYVGIVIFLNLTLALGISFLSGRRAGT